MLATQRILEANKLLKNSLFGAILKKQNHSEKEAYIEFKEYIADAVQLKKFMEYDQYREKYAGEFCS